MASRTFTSNTRDEFIKNTEKIMDEISSSYENLLEELTMEIWAEWIAGTPVDTGRARASIIATKDAPSDYVPPDGPSQEPKIPNLKGSRLEKFNWVVSNIDYMVDLNEGTSIQAPKNFIEKAIVTAIARVNGRA